MKRTTMILLLVSIPLLALLNLTIGSVAIPLSEVLDILAGRGSESEVWQNIVLGTRLPQTLTAIACGAGLAVAGLEMQTVFHNPLAGPSVLGVSSAASLGVAMVVLLNGWIGGGVLTRFGLVGNAALTVAAIAGALAVMALILWLSKRVEGGATLLIVGVLIGYIATAIIGVMKYFSSEEDIRAYVIWGLGSFSRVTGGQIEVFVGLMAVTRISRLCFTFSSSMSDTGTLAIYRPYGSISSGAIPRREAISLICSSWHSRAICMSVFIAKVV